MKHLTSACALLSLAAASNARPIYAPLLPPPTVNPATVAIPELAFTPTPEVESDYGKYFFFHRDGVDFTTAYRDVRECDQLGRKLGGALPATNVPYPYAGTMAGAAGGLLGALIVDATIGAANRRAMRRENEKRCMTFKGYTSFGLPKALWNKFNFQEGLRSPPAEERETMLQVQAKVASGPPPSVGEIK